jgi:putative membrane protein
MASIKLEKNETNEKLVNILAIAIPLAVALLIGIRTKIDLGSWTKILPHLIGILNTTTSITLMMGYIFVKSNNVSGHTRMMYLSFIQGSLFLVLYILYHISNPSTPFGGEGFIRPIYYILLISHIGLSIGVVWFVLKAVYYALSNQIEQHKKIVKWTFPLWLYVSVSGVIVYLMISPYYSN